jgi:muramoyltetrapeptide carboxypeptidase
MERRNFLASLNAALAVSLLYKSSPGRSSWDASLIRPRALRAGDTIGLITPATYVPDPDNLAQAERTLRFFGLRMKMGKHAGRRMGDYQRSIQERLDDLHEMFSDREVSAVFCIRGGYGSMHLLDKIDYDLIRRNPKIFLGYSDITVMHLAILKRSRLVTFHGPMMLAGFTGYTQSHFRRALFETKPLGVLTNPPDENQLRPAHPLRRVRGGQGTGELTGGNLTLISTTLGTPFEIETRGKILFLEDVDEEPHRVDRMLTQLRLAGKFEGVRGIIFGECANCRPSDYKPSSVSVYSLGEILDNIFGSLNVPVLSGLTIGHTSDQLTLPLGVQATLDADKGTLEIKEPAVV